MQMELGFFCFYLIILCLIQKLLSSIRATQNDLLKWKDQYDDINSKLIQLKRRMGEEEEKRKKYNKMDGLFL
jgi:molecular chaperone GrpE (heat shock protein)